jgi:hypothetical protein
MREQRIRTEIDLPSLTPFEFAVLKRLKESAPAQIPYEDLCQPCSPQNQSYLNRLVVTGLVMQSRCEDGSVLMSLTYVGEQVGNLLADECQPPKSG